MAAGGNGSASVPIDPSPPTDVTYLKRTRPLSQISCAGASVLFIPHPTSSHFKCDNFFKIMQDTEYILYRSLFLCAAFPYISVHCAENQIRIADDFWILLAENAGQKMLEIVLVSNEQIAVWTIAAGFVQRKHDHRVDMDHQWQFPLVHLTLALRALRPSHILVWIEKEAVTGRQFAQLYCMSLFSWRHRSSTTPRES